MSSDSRSKKIRVLVVDDSRLMNAQISGILGGDSDIEVIGNAMNGLEALELIPQLKPDVITLDVEMPKMNGISALKHIMVKHEIPTVMISALTQEGSDTTFEAFKYGAIDVVAKPSKRDDQSMEGQKADIVGKVKRAAGVRTGKSRYVRMATVDPGQRKNSSEKADSRTRLIGIATGTGGYYSLLRIVPLLSADFSDVMIAVSLVAERYLEPFISYLQAHSAIPVKSARGVSVPLKGGCYLCSSLSMPTVAKEGDSFKFVLGAGSTNSEPEGPLDSLFRSMAQTFGQKAVAVVMSGPGSDGAEGIAEVRSAGGMGVVQDITNCMDPAMPLAVLGKGSVEKILPDFLMAEFFMKLGDL